MTEGNKSENTEDEMKLKVLDTTFDIIEHLHHHPGLGPTKIADQLDLPKSTTYVHLQSLEKRGYVRSKNGEYFPQLRFLHYGGKIRNQIPLYRYGRSEANKLAEKTGELVNLGVEEEGRGVVIYMARGSETPIDLEPVGKFSHLHQSAYGRAILAELPMERVETVIEHQGLPEVTEFTISDLSELYQELEKTRERGYSIERNEGNVGISCIGTAILDGDGQPLGAVSITFPTNKLDDEDFKTRMSQLVLDTANVIELKIEKPVPDDPLNRQPLIDDNVE